MHPQTLDHWKTLLPSCHSSTQPPHLLPEPLQLREVQLSTRSQRNERQARVHERRQAGHARTAQQAQPIWPAGHAGLADGRGKGRRRARSEAPGGSCSTRQLHPACKSAGAGPATACQPPRRTNMMPVMAGSCRCCAPRPQTCHSGVRAATARAAATAAALMAGGAAGRRARGSRPCQQKGAQAAAALGFPTRRAAPPFESWARRGAA